MDGSNNTPPISAELQLMTAVDRLLKENRELKEQARLLEEIRQAVRIYHQKLDTRQHGGVAAHALVDSVLSTLNAQWTFNADRNSQR